MQLWALNSGAVLGAAKQLQKPGGRNTLYSMYNLEHTSDCAVQINGRLLQDTDQFPLKFWLSTNPLNPHLEIELHLLPRTVSKLAGEAQTVTAIFSLYREGESYQRQPKSYDSWIDQPVRPAGTFSFSSQVQELESFSVTRLGDKIDSIVPKRWPADKKTSHECLSWLSTGCTIVDATPSNGLSQAATTEIAYFKRLFGQLQPNSKLAVNTLIHVPAKHSYNPMYRILSLPSPTPPSYWPWLKPILFKNGTADADQLPMSFDDYRKFELSRDWITQAFGARPNNWSKAASVNQIPVLAADTAMLSMHSAVTNFESSRQYLAHQLGSHTYEALASQADAGRYYNGKHRCHVFVDLQQGTSRHIVLLNIGKPKVPTKDPRSDSDTLAANAECMLPEVGELVLIELTLDPGIGPEAWTGRVIRIPDRLMKYGPNTAVLAIRPPNAKGRVLTQQIVTADLYFGHHGRKLEFLRKAITRLCVDDEPQQKWLKDILLAQDLKKAVSDGHQPQGYHGLPKDWKDKVEKCCKKYSFNKEQRRAIQSFYENRFSILVGPPGTGKTTVINAILELEVEFRSVPHVVTESNKALDVLVEKVCKTKGSAYPDLYFRLKSTFQETLCEEDNNGTWSDTGPVKPRSNDPGLIAISDFFADVNDPQAKMALGVHIEKRLKWLSQGGKDQLWKNEIQCLQKLRLYRRMIRNMGTSPTPLDSSATGADPKKKLDQQIRDDFWATLLIVQSQYVSRARCIFTKAANSSCTLAKSLNPTTIIVDDASQAVEPEVVHAILRGVAGGKLRRVLIVGDDNQLPPVIVAKRNPFQAQGKLSLLERLNKAGYPATMLKEQFRMHPHISKVPNDAIYMAASFGTTL